MSVFHCRVRRPFARCGSPHLVRLNLPALAPAGRSTLWGAREDWRSLLETSSNAKAQIPYFLVTFHMVQLLYNPQDILELHFGSGTLVMAPHHSIDSLNLLPGYKRPPRDCPLQSSVWKLKRRCSRGVNSWQEGVSMRPSVAALRGELTKVLEGAFNARSLSINIRTFSPLYRLSFYQSIFFS